MKKYRDQANVSCQKGNCTKPTMRTKARYEDGPRAIVECTELSTTYRYEPFFFMYFGPGCCCIACWSRHETRTSMRQAVLRWKTPPKL